MFIWRNEETAEQAALQILNILYSVPQLSVKLGSCSDSHLNMIRHWFTYWNENKHVLIDGDFIPSNPGANYPVLTAINDNHQITTTYEDVVIQIDSEVYKLDIINAKSTTHIAAFFNSPFSGTLSVMDCMGNIIVEKSVKFDKGINQLDVPCSGIAYLIKK